MDKNFKGTKEEYLEFRKKSNERNRKYYFKNHKRLLKEHGEYRRKNKEKISEYGRRLRARPEYKARMKRWAEENREHMREYRKTPERRAAKRISDKKHYLKRRSDPEKVEEERAKQRIFRKNNIKKVRKYNQKYYSSPKGKINYTHHNHRRIALIKSRPFNLSNKKVKEIFNRDKVCVYCGSDIKLELDHIVPLKLGGNSLFNNFVIACKKCNCSKSGRDVFYWCKLRKIDVPEIILELLKLQNSN